MEARWPPVVSSRKDNFLVSSDESLLDLAWIHENLAQVYWCVGVPEEVVVQSFKNSFSFGLYQLNTLLVPEIIGFARVVTDYVTYGYLADVFVTDKMRNKGLARWMLQFILCQPTIASCRHLMLATRDAHKLYASLGWQPLSKPECLMEVVRADIYSRQPAAPRALLEPIRWSAVTLPQVVVCATRGNYQIRSPASDWQYLHAQLTHLDATTGISLEAVQLAWQNSLTYGLFHQNTQVGFARFTTDYAVFACLSDLFVEEAHRTAPLREWLLETMMQQPFVKGLRRMVVHVKPQDQALYGPAGWQVPANPGRFMEILRSEVFKAEDSKGIASK
jgi:GNAT superfamily N-acetyltransferase